MKMILFNILAVFLLAASFALAASTITEPLKKAWAKVATPDALIILNADQRAVAFGMVNEAGQYAPRITELNNTLRDLQDQCEVLTNTALADNRELTVDENTLHSTLMNQFKQTRTEVQRLEEMQENANFLNQVPAGQNRPAAIVPDPQNNGGQQSRHNAGGGQGSDRPRIQIVDNQGANGFRHFGEFANSVIKASNRTLSADQYDQRLLMNAPTTFSQESVGEDGGFLVPPDYREAIMKQVMGEDSLLMRCDEFSTSKNSIVVPQDVTTPWGTNGIQAYWDGEADQYAQSKPQFKDKQARLNKLTALVPVTEEMLEDAPLIGSYLMSKAPEVMDFKISDAIVNGTGAGMPMGFMNSGSLITVAAEGSQVADTVLAANISKMWNRMYAPYRGNSVWLINQDIEPELDNMFIPVTNVAGTENVGGLPVYIPAGGLSASPYATLKGRPVIPIQSMQTLGDLGDIALVDLRRYMAATKAGGIRQDVSMHLWFDYDMAAFKFRFRMAGSPWFDAPITPKNSVNTLSAFVTLAARA